MNDTTAAAARRWIAERLLWERFLEDASRRAAGGPVADDLAERPAA